MKSMACSNPSQADEGLIAELTSRWRWKTCPPDA
jgi:hypothetical protein